jgi:anti-sigma-K factor RskA
LNTADYISSGILELYALGALSESERLEVERNLTAYPELRIELNEIEKIQERLLTKSSMHPPKGTKEKVLKSLRQDKATVVNLSRWKMLAAAAVIIAVVSSALAFNYWQKWRGVSSELITERNQNKRVAEDYNKVNRDLDQLKNDLKVIDNPQFQKVVMKGTPASPESTASVYWNQKTTEVYLRIENLKDLSKEKQYQLWAIIDGKPVDAGVFDANTVELLKMKGVANGVDKFAVTIEPRGGNLTPSLETLQVIGDVDKG